MNPHPPFVLNAAAILASAFWFSAATAAAEPPIPAASELIDRHLQAVGGRQALADVSSLTLKGTGREGGQVFSVEAAFKAPGMIRITLRTTEGAEFRHGRSADAVTWAHGPGGVKRVTNDEDRNSLLELALALTPFGQLRLAELYGDGTSQLVTNAAGSFHGVCGPRDPTPRLLFDATSGLLARLGPLAIEDYRVVGGLRLPHRARTDRVSFQFEEAALNPALDDAQFAMPTGAAAPPDPGAPPALRTLLSRAGQLEVVRRPAAMEFGRGALAELPRWQATASRPWQVDVRSVDLRNLDLSQRLADLLHADFDSRTRWPVPLPDRFDPQRILELGKDPGLRVRALHAQGVTGKGVGIGVIDQTLLVEHGEYRDRLRLYEEIHSHAEVPAAMHGAAVASIAAGRTVGVAPDADLYFIAEWHVNRGPDGQQEWDFTPLAEAINRLLDVNQTLPAARKLRVISISVGWGPNQKGYAEVTAAVERAKRDGVFVVSTSLESGYGLKFHGLGRDPLADPNCVESFGPGSWWANQFWSGRHRFGPGERLLVPMDSRTTASPTGADEYTFYRDGGWSWSVPWISGLYALGCQVKPDLTPEVFWSEALKTGRTIRVSHDGQEVEFGTIADPVALIARLRELK